MLKNNIRQLRKEHCLTQMELAKKLGVSTSAVGMYEQGRREPDFKILTKMAEIFGVSTDSLLGVYLKKDDNPKNIDDIISDMKEYLVKNKGVKFNGVELEDEEIEQIINALKVGVKLAIEKDKK